MKRLLPMIAGLVVILGGLAGWHFGLFGVQHRKAADPPAFVLKQAVWITEGPITSNLAGSIHYISLTVSFPVMPQALQKAGGAPPAAGTTGTGSTALDSQIETAVTDLCRRTAYASLQTPTGMRDFRQALRRVIAPYFSPGTVGSVETPSLVTQ
ncbi:MAG: flagellar basal body-associated FliL family protein [Clostridia bacterium]